MKSIFWGGGEWWDGGKISTLILAKCCISSSSKLTFYVLLLTQLSPRFLRIHICFWVRFSFDENLLGLLSYYLYYIDIAINTNYYICLLVTFILHFRVTFQFLWHSWLHKARPYLGRMADSLFTTHLIVFFLVSFHF